MGGHVMVYGDGAIWQHMFEQMFIQAVMENGIGSAAVVFFA